MPSRDHRRRPREADGDERGGGGRERGRAGLHEDPGEPAEREPLDPPPEDPQEEDGLDPRPERDAEGESGEAERADRGDAERDVDGDREDAAATGVRVSFPA